MPGPRLRVVQTNDPIAMIPQAGCAGGSMEEQTKGRLQRTARAYSVTRSDGSFPDLEQLGFQPSFAEQDVCHGKGIEIEDHPNQRGGDLCLVEHSQSTSKIGDICSCRCITYAEVISVSEVLAEELQILHPNKIISHPCVIQEFGTPPLCRSPEPQSAHPSHHVGSAPLKPKPFVAEDFVYDPDVVPASPLTMTKSTYMLPGPYVHKHQPHHPYWSVESFCPDQVSNRAYPAYESKALPSVDATQIKQGAVASKHASELTRLEAMCGSLSAKMLDTGYKPKMHEDVGYHYEGGPYHSNAHQCTPPRSIGARALGPDPVPKPPGLTLLTRHCHCACHEGTAAYIVDELLHQGFTCTVLACRRLSALPDQYLQGFQLPHQSSSTESVISTRESISASNFWDRPPQGSASGYNNGILRSPRRKPSAQRALLRYIDGTSGTHQHRASVAARWLSPLQTYSDVVLKMIHKSKCDQLELTRVVQETQFLSYLSHPNIVELLASFDGTNELWMFFERAPYLDLESVMNGRVVSESDAALITYQLLCGLEYCHRKGIIHGDLKPKNVLLYDDGKKARNSSVFPEWRNIRLCLADFGLALCVAPGKNNIKFERLQGSHGYFAPEILMRRDYDMKVDMWALGIIVFQLLGGYEPWYPASACITEPIRFEDSSWKVVSDLGKNFIRGLLKPNPAERMSATQGLVHDWIRTMVPSEILGRHSVSSDLAGSIQADYSDDPKCTELDGQTLLRRSDPNNHSSTQLVSAQAADAYNQQMDSAPGVYLAIGAHNNSATRNTTTQYFGSGFSSHNSLAGQPKKDQ